MSKNTMFQQKKRHQAFNMGVFIIVSIIYQHCLKSIYRLQLKKQKPSFKKLYRVYHFKTRILKILNISRNYC